MKDNFTKFLGNHKKESFSLAATRGNSGDALIRKGLELYLKVNKYKITNCESADNIIIHGGANINDVWKLGIDLLKKIIEKYPNKRIIIAPHSVYFYKTNFEKILNNCKQEIHFFTREKYSYERLSKMNLNKNIHLYLANDTAFLLEYSNYIENLKKKSNNKYILVSLRIDYESHILDKKKLKFFENVFGRFGLREIFERVYHQIISKQFIRRNLKNRKAKIIIADASLENYDKFIDLILNASEIYTDRLHVGVLGAILNKRVYLYSSSYKKIEGVYEQSLKKYPNIIKRFEI